MDANLFDLLSFFESNDLIITKAISPYRGYFRIESI